MCGDVGFRTWLQHMCCALACQTGCPRIWQRSEEDKSEVKEKDKVKGIGSQMLGVIMKFKQGLVLTR